jgi:1,4-dihydroxy-2-naphthoyl-CoA synthase
MTDTPYILQALADGVTTLALNRPESRNALSIGMLQALNRALADIAKDPATRVVIIRGEGPAFCAGHDLKEMRSTDFAKTYSEQLFGECTKAMLAIIHLPKPVIAQVHGIATAAGCQLVASCDLAVAADSARFATPGVNIGLFCSTPMVALSRNVGRKAAMRMLLTGDLIDASTALAIGLISDIAPAESLADRTHVLASTIAAKSAVTLAIGKEAFYRQAEMSLSDAYTYTSATMVENLGTPDAHEGINAFLQKRSPKWSAP